MEAPPPGYSIDTSALIDWWVRYYPPKAFKGLLTRVEELVDNGRLRSSIEVREECSKYDDELHRWTKTQSGLFVESDETIQRMVTKLLSKHYDPKTDKGINGADPFVIAVALQASPHWAVVSAEHPGSLETQKIPWVCKHHDPIVQHMSFLEMVLAEGWVL